MRRLVMALASVAALTAGVPSRADDIKVIGSNGVKSSLEAIVPAFEKSTGHRIVFTWGAAIPLKAAIENGAQFDVAILTAEILDDLVRQGRLVATTRTRLANSYAGVAVRKGAPKPDIGTVAAFKRALVDAQSVAFVERGSTGIYLTALLARLGLAEALKDKLRPLPPENPAAKAVADGEAELGMTQISEILPYPGAELVGPLPKEIELTTTFAAAAGSETRQPEAAAELVRFIANPTAAAIYRAKGLDPIR